MAIFMAVVVKYTSQVRCQPRTCLGSQPSLANRTSATVKVVARLQNSSSQLWCILVQIFTPKSAAQDLQPCHRFIVGSAMSRLGCLHVTLLDRMEFELVTVDATS